MKFIRRLALFTEKLPISFFIAVTLVLHILRSPTMFFHPQLWAEDGPIFFAQDFQFGPTVLFQNYAGYVHLWPRLVALVCGYVPLEFVPHAYILFALLSHTILLLVISMDRFPATRNQKILMMLATVLVPHHGEVFLNIANINSFCAIFTVVVVLLKPARHLGGQIVEGISLIISGLSGPFILLSYPPLLIYLLAFKKCALASRRLTASFLTLAFIGQAYFLDFGARHPDPADTSALHWINLLAIALNSIFVANIRMSDYLGMLLAVIFLAMFYYLFLYQKSFREWRENSEPLLCLICAAAIFAACLFVCRSFVKLIGPFAAGPRYFYAPYVLVLFGVILVNGKQQFHRIQIGLLTSSFLTSIYFYAPPKVWPDYHWSDQVAHYRAQGALVFRTTPDWTVGLDHAQCWRANRE